MPNGALGSIQIAGWGLFNVDLLLVGAGVIVAWLFVAPPFGSHKPGIHIAI